MSGIVEETGSRPNSHSTCKRLQSHLAVLRRNNNWKNRISISTSSLSSGSLERTLPCTSGASSTTFSLTSSSSEGPLSTRPNASFARSSGGVPACCALPHECVLLWSPSQSSRDEHPGPPSQRLPLRVQTAYFQGTHTSAHDPSAHSVSSLSHTK